MLKIVLPIRLRRLLNIELHGNNNRLCSINAVVSIAIFYTVMLYCRQPSNHEVPPMHKPMQAKSRDLSLHLGVSSQPFRDLEAQYCRPLSDTYHLTYDSQFGESMLATEV